MNEKQEVWKPVKGFEGLYFVSNTGKVVGTVRPGSSGTELKGFENKGGYLTVMLYRHPFYKHFFIHRLVADAFIPNPENKRTVNHKDGNKKNNCVENLEWMTHGENHKHAYRTGLKVVSEKQRKAASETGKKTCHINREKIKKPVYKIDDFGNAEWFESCKAGANSVCGLNTAVVACCRGKKLTYKGYRWRYADRRK